MVVIAAGFGADRARACAKQQADALLHRPVERDLERVG